MRQTIDLGGETQKVEAGQIKYANSPKTDLLNWALTNTFDYAGVAWGFTYGAAAECCHWRGTLRAGVFDLSETPRQSLRQQVTPDVGIFGRAGWADGAVEPWDFTDIDEMGILIGDGAFPNPGLEKIIEACCSCAVNPRPSSPSIISSSTIPRADP